VTLPLRNRDSVLGSRNSRQLFRGPPFKCCIERTLSKHSNSRHAKRESSFHFQPEDLGKAGGLSRRDGLAQFEQSQCARLVEDGFPGFHSPPIGSSR
jgi:hypothetical protein